MLCVCWRSKSGGQHKPGKYAHADIHAPTQKDHERLSRQHRYEPPPEFPRLCPVQASVTIFRVLTLVLFR